MSRGRALAARRAAFGALALLAAAAAPLGAQQVSEARVREAIDDAARGLGQAVAGGSPLTAPAAVTGGLGHFQLGVAGAATRIDVEDPRRPSGTLEFTLPVGTVNGAVGIARGGALGFGALDLIGRAGPVLAREDYRESRPLYALGARVGILGESAVRPSVSATLSRSWIDRLEYGDPDQDEIGFVADIRVISARIDVSKKLLLLTPYAGAGVDRTSIDARYRIPASRSTGNQDIAGRFETSSEHHKAYAGVELGLALVLASIEAGIYDGGAFAALGLHVGF